MLISTALHVYSSILINRTAVNPEHNPEVQTIRYERIMVLDEAADQTQIKRHATNPRMFHVNDYLDGADNKKLVGKQKKIKFNKKILEMKEGTQFQKIYICKGPSSTLISQTY